MAATMKGVALLPLITTMLTMPTVCLAFRSHICVPFSRNWGCILQAFPTSVRTTGPTLTSRTTFLAATASLSTTTNSTNHNRTLSSSKRDLQHVLHIAKDAARHAGHIMTQTTGRIEVASTKANLQDLVTESDVACQQVIQQTVESVFPNDIFLGEEDVESGPEASMAALERALSDINTTTDTDALVWICDPIDGTTNFQAGLPLFGASIGVVGWNDKTNEPEVVVGVIYNPVLDEMISAVKGQGAYLNGKQLNERDATKSRIPLDQSLVNVGFPVTQQSTLLASSRAVSALSTRVRGLRMIASAAQVLSWIAQDKLQCYVSWNLNSWDICAGMLIVRESGGHLVNFDRMDADIASRDMIMTSKGGGSELALEVLEILQDNDCLAY